MLNVSLYRIARVRLSILRNFIKLENYFEQIPFIFALKDRTFNQTQSLQGQVVRKSI